MVSLKKLFKKFREIVTLLSNLFANLENETIFELNGVLQEIQDLFHLKYWKPLVFDQWLVCNMIFCTLHICKEFCCQYWSIFVGPFFMVRFFFSHHIQWFPKTATFIFATTFVPKVVLIVPKNRQGERVLADKTSRDNQHHKFFPVTKCNQAEKKSFTFGIRSRNA